MLVEQVKTQDDKLETMIVGIQPMLDCVGLQQLEEGRLSGDGAHRSIMDRYHMAWMYLKEFTRSVTHGAIIHALA